MKGLVGLFLLFFPLFCAQAGSTKVLLDEISKPTWETKWIHIKKTPKQSIHNLLNILRKSPTGEKVYRTARAKLLREGSSFDELLAHGENSLTDTTLIRRFSPSDPMDVEYLTRSKIYINQYHNVLDALLDLAHELTHFNHRSSFNPYDVNFNWKDFVAATVEGKGGEVEAYMVECQVMKEINYKHYINGSKCLKITDQNTGKLSRHITTKEFYKVGKYIGRFASRLQDFKLKAEHDFPLSAKESLFVSSAYGLPYPIAALEEYAIIMATVCTNDKKRFDLLDRSPASLGGAAQRQFEKFQSRCSNFLP